VKKILFPALALLLLVLVGCSGQEEAGSEEAGSADVYIITDRFFSQQIMGILQDSDSFVGRTIQYRGMFVSQFWDATGETFHYVGQLGDDCCTPGESLGFEVYLNNIPPVDNETWVEVTGVLEWYDVVGFGPILRLSATYMEVVEDPAL